MQRLPSPWACRAAGVLSVLASLNADPVLQAGAGCPADVDNNHQVDVDDLFAVLDAWGGTVDIDEVFGVIGAWGPCPCLPQFGCIEVEPIWCEDFELGNYSRWTSGYYDYSSCAINNFASDRFVSPDTSQKSEVICTSSQSHRGYGGLRFQGDDILPNYATPSVGGLEAPFGVIVTFHSWLDVPYTFNSTKWLSLMTITDDCSNNWNDVVTLNIDDASMRLKPVHVSTVQYAQNAPSFPLQQWNRTTVYINYYSEVMHVWQNGVKVVSATFTRPTTDMCQWHFGLYASGPNNDITLYEDDISIVRLSQPLTNFIDEPWFFEGSQPCGYTP